MTNPKLVRMKDPITPESWKLPGDTPPEVLGVAQALREAGYGVEAVGKQSSKGSSLYYLMTKRKDEAPLMVCVSIGQSLGTEQ